MHYQRVINHGDPGGVEKIVQGKYDKNTICAINDCESPVRARDLCSAHYQKWHKYGDALYVFQPKNNKTDPYIRIFIDGKSKLEHRHVMEQYLRRDLLPHENVHHINGDRKDNHIENLELWSTSQPPGQRIEDKINWAIELLSIYQPESLRNKCH